MPFPELPQFILPPYPALGWNDIPPPPPPADQPDIGDNNWGNDVWENAVDLQEEEVAEQESMVLDQSDDQSVSVEQQNHQQNFVLVHDVEQLAMPKVGQPVMLNEGQPAVEEQNHIQNQVAQLENAPIYNPNEWAMVVYQPAVTAMEEEHPLVIDTDSSASEVIFGPELPPELAFRRSFEAILDCNIIYVGAAIFSQ